MGIGKGASVWMLLSGTRLEESTLPTAHALCYIKHACATSAFIQRSETEPSRVLGVSEFLFVYLYVILQFLVPKEFVKKLKHLSGAILLWLLPPNIPLLSLHEAHRGRREHHKERNLI